MVGTDGWETEDQYDLHEQLSMSEVCPLADEQRDYPRSPLKE